MILSAIDIRNCRFEDCTAESAGALHMNRNGSPQKGLISGCIFKGCTAGSGGAIGLAGAPVQIEACKFIGCNAWGQHGGGIYTTGFIDVILREGCVFERCAANSLGIGYGGALHCSGTLAMYDVTLRECFGWTFIAVELQMTMVRVTMERCASVSDAVNCPRLPQSYTNHTRQNRSS